MESRFSMNKLTEIFNDAIEFNAKYVAVKVILPDSIYPEIIINPRENFSDKLKYYQNTYNSECVHKNVPTIMIVDCTYGNTMLEIQNGFED